MCQGLVRVLEIFEKLWKLIMPYRKVLDLSLIKILKYPKMNIVFVHFTIYNIKYKPQKGNRI